MSELQDNLRGPTVYTIGILGKGRKTKYQKKKIAEIMAETFSLWMKTVSPRIKDAQRTKKENDMNENYNIV